MIAGARTFLRDFASYAGRKGFIAVAFVLMSALLEGISLAFLVPLLGIVIGTGVARGPRRLAQRRELHLAGSISVS